MRTLHKPTKAERYYQLLSDGLWHSTKELARNVGHTFASAKRQLEHAGYQIRKRRHPSRRYQWQYRLA